MNATKRGAFHGIVNSIILQLFKTHHLVVLGLSNPFMRCHAVGTEVLHAIEAAGVGHRLVFAVGTVSWVLHGQDVQHVVDKGVAWEGIHPFCWYRYVNMTLGANKGSIMMVPLSTRTNSN